MAKGDKVYGFDYVTGKAVTMTPREWRAAYPAHHFDRETKDGETWYRSKATLVLVAEAYAIIPAGK